jgi:hypothetical protein
LAQALGYKELSLSLGLGYFHSVSWNNYFRILFILGILITNDFYTFYSNVNEREFYEFYFQIALTHL